jgi:hypothetical protein
MNSDVVISEIMYNPISGDADDEYVELYNRSSGVVDLGGWRFMAGIDFHVSEQHAVRPETLCVGGERRGAVC